eukprot:scaffold20606_cov58-Attheya_sp.AAC.4
MGLTYQRTSSNDGGYSYYDSFDLKMQGHRRCWYRRLINIEARQVTPHRALGQLQLRPVQPPSHPVFCLLAA